MFIGEHVNEQMLFSKSKYEANKTTETKEGSIAIRLSPE